MSEPERTLEQQRLELAKWLLSQPRCVGYPGCDGDLVGEPHDEDCPLHKIEGSEGRASMVTTESSFAAGWQASARHHAGEIASQLRSKATAIRKQGNPGWIDVAAVLLDEAYEIERRFGV
jgi:hypothetical protein